MLLSTNRDLPIHICFFPETTDMQLNPHTLNCWLAHVLVYICPSIQLRPFCATRTRLSDNMFRTVDLFKTLPLVLVKSTFQKFILNKWVYIKNNILCCSCSCKFCNQKNTFVCKISLCLDVCMCVRARAFY